MRDWTCQFYKQELPPVDAALADRQIIAAPGVVVVQMAPRPDGVGSVLIVGADSRVAPDAACVLSAAPGIGLVPGDWVIVDHYRGMRVGGFATGSFEAREEVRFYGRLPKRSQSGQIVKIVAWWSCVLAHFDPTQTTMETIVRPTGRNVLIERSDVQASQGGVLLTAAATYRDCKARVIALGESVGRIFPELRVGDIVQYMPGELHPLHALGFAEEVSGNTNFALIDAERILAVYVSESSWR